MASRCQQGIVSAIGKGSAIRYSIDRHRGISDSRAAITDGYNEVRSPSLWGGALGELEVPDPGPPGSAGCGNVFLGVPKRAVVYWVNRHVAVIAPAIAASGLAASSVNKSRFALGQSINGIARQPAGVFDTGEGAGTGDAVAKRQVARLIHRRAPHPTPECVGLISALLKDYRRGSHGAELKPAHTCYATRTHGIVAYDRLVAVIEFPIGSAEHQTVADGIQGLAATRLRHTGSGCGTDRGKAGGGRSANLSKSGVSRGDEIGVEKPDLVGAGTRERNKGTGGAGGRQS